VPAPAQVNNWQINDAVRYNAWANLGTSDFMSVVTAYKALAAKFECVT
jgi:hypothetical protein